MTLFEPTLIVTRLVVERGASTAYDEQFHAGVNVIRGENSSGKSTILNFIYYGLGGDLADWSEAALLCTRVTLEVRINDKPATLSREISRTFGQPMEIFGGPYQLATRAPKSEWVRYPYRRSQNLESFSQAMFRLLDIPEVVNDTSATLTMHQILRLLYSDQLSPVEHIFRFDSRYDTPILRETVGRLLCGAHDPKVYANEVKLRELKREFDAATGELTSLFAVLGKTGHSLTMDWLDAERRSLQAQMANIQTQIEATERELFQGTSENSLTLKSQERAYDEVQKYQSQLVAARQQRDALLLAIADSTRFIAALELKITALNDSSKVAEHLGNVAFDICPACHSPINRAGLDENSCHLCKASLEPGRGMDRIVAMINDASIQLKQSRILQAAREERRIEIEKQIVSLEESWKRAASTLASSQRVPTTEIQERLRILNRQEGYLNRQVEDLDQKAEVIQLIDATSAKKRRLNDQITHLEMENEKLYAAQERRYDRARTLIADEVRTLLKNDLRRQDSFESPENIRFDFAANKIEVDGHTYFSASSRVILKSSFFLGFFAAATKDPNFRHPRFLMVDTTEDKGMEPERSHNFQNQILRVSREAKADHQIIYATAMISPDLDDENFLIGKFSTRDDFSLEIH